MLMKKIIINVVNDISSKTPQNESTDNFQKSVTHPLQHFPDSLTSYNILDSSCIFSLSMQNLERICGVITYDNYQLDCLIILILYFSLLNILSSFLARSSCANYATPRSEKLKLVIQFFIPNYSCNTIRVRSIGSSSEYLKKCPAGKRVN